MLSSVSFNSKYCRLLKVKNDYTFLISTISFNFYSKVFTWQNIMQFTFVLFWVVFFLL